ncbi:DeoR/GlpR family DNA-binding transcription regulator [Haloimpatiens sp. FM7330]|uniref:DeoR/GlpR family DNA-binding transcription regulator n=1 Tax=Haloimpatiens sp. FM7330 TaxID=3298610 RepID=UPI0036301B93
MFAQERLEEILKVLNKDGKVLVKDLSKRFDVSEDCIRKDLRNLESQNLLERTYGGAIPLRKSAPNQKVEARIYADVESKKKIAEKAFNIIKNNETIFLDISTTNILLAQELAESNKKITIITNMIDIVKTFSNNNIKVICIGGVFSKDLDGFTGSMAIENISKYKVNKAFIGSCGVDIFDKSITTFDVEDGNTKKAIIESGKEIYLVMENKKFYMDGVYKFATLYDINTIITEDTPKQDILKALKKTNTNIL